MLGWTFNPPPGLKIRNPTTRRGVLKLSEKPRGWLLTRRKTFSKGKGCPKKYWRMDQLRLGRPFCGFFKGRCWKTCHEKRQKKMECASAKNRYCRCSFLFWLGGTKTIYVQRACHRCGKFWMKSPQWQAVGVRNRDLRRKVVQTPTTLPNLHL